MKRAVILAAILTGFVFGANPVLADQRPRNPGGGGGGSTSGGGSTGGSDGSTGRVATPRDGGSSPWGGGSVSSRPSEPSRPATSGRRPARVSGGDAGRAGMTVPPYSRPRGGAPVTGYAVPRGSVATLPPIISGPIYWGPDSWYFYPWGYGGLALGYFWDPWMWSGYYGGWGGYGGYGYPWVDPYWGGSGGGGGWSGSDAASTGGQSAQASDVPNPLDPAAPNGGLRLRIVPREAEVFVDGYYAGLVDDFDGAMQRLKIAIGPHRVEVRAPGYESLTFDVTIVEGQTTTYKAELKRN